MTSGDGKGESGEDRIEAIIQIAERLAADDVRDGYTHIGPATSGAFRFKWTARQQPDGTFIVDETVGSGTVAVRSRRLAKDEVLAYIEQRQGRLQTKVDEVKRELASIQGLPPDLPAEVERDPLQMYDEIRRLLKESK